MKSFLYNFYISDSVSWKISIAANLTDVTTPAGYCDILRFQGLQLLITR